MASDSAKKMASDPTEKSLDQYIEEFSKTPEWALLSAQKYYSGHRGAASYLLAKWRADDPELTLQKAVSRYLEGTKPNLPADVLKKVIEIVIDVFETQKDDRLVEAYSLSGDKT